MEPRAKRVRTSSPPVDALKKLFRFGDVSVRLVDGALPERARLLLEGLSRAEAEVYFNRKHGMQLLETLARAGCVDELRFLIETLDFKEVLLQKHGRLLVGEAMEADTPCVDTIRYLIEQGFSLDLMACKKWTLKRCSVTHLRRILETFDELVPDAMQKYGAHLVQDIYSTIGDRHLRQGHMEALRGLVQLTAKNASFICRSRTSSDQGARIEEIVEENEIDQHELVEIYELVELFAHLEADTPPQALSFLRESIVLRQRLAMADSSFVCQGRKLMSSLEELDALETQMAKGDFTDAVWQMLLIAAKHGLVYNAMRWQYFRSLKCADDVAATKDFVMAIVGPSATGWFLPKIGVHYARLLMQNDWSPLVALRKLYFFLQDWFDMKPERRSPQERALVVIIVIMPLRMVRSAQIEDHLRELRGKLDEVLFILAFALSTQQMSQPILGVCPSNRRTPLTALMMHLVWLLIHRGANLSRLPRQSQSTLKTLVDGSTVLPKVIREQLAARICCPLALVRSDRALFEKISDPKRPVRLHCLALEACRNLPKSYFKGKISQRGLVAVSRHRPLI